MTQTEIVEGAKAHRGAIARAVAPLLVVNALTVYGQLAYAMAAIAPASWPLVARVALSIGFAVAIESVSLYVQWHAHDALLLKSHSTARALRRWSFLIAAAVGAMNYSHFAAADFRPTAAAIAFGMLSLLSPWMWGLHSRRAARIQLLKERRVDDAGAEFSSTRKRMFPVRTWMAYRWSIDQNETDPVRAWDGYKASKSVHTSMPVDVIAEVEALSASTPGWSVKPVRTSSKAASWDVEKAVAMILADASTEEIMEVCKVGAKPLQLARRCVRFLTDGMDVEATAVKVPCSLAHVQRVKAAMV